MRAVVQRVSEASVTVDGAELGRIGRGLLVYLGVGKGDDAGEGAWLLDKILGLRVFENDAGKIDASVVDVGGALLVVSQFTLFADLRRGRRPGFDEAMPPAAAAGLYDAFVRDAGARLPVATGRFGADMRVHSTNAGPFTLLLDTAVLRARPRPPSAAP